MENGRRDVFFFKPTKQNKKINQSNDDIIEDCKKAKKNFLIFCVDEILFSKKKRRKLIEDIDEFF